MPLEPSLVLLYISVIRLEFNKVEIKRESVVVRDLVEKVVELMFPSAAQKGIDLTWHVARGVPRAIFTDGARLNQILVNCVGNGVKFTTSGEVSVVADVDEASGALRIAIRDTGIGISAEDQKKLFSWFYQADSGHAREYNGTGLGLFISRKLAVLLGGSLTCSSELGRGSSFVLCLPRAAVAEPAEKAVQGDANGSSHHPSSPAVQGSGGLTLAGRRVAIATHSPATFIAGQTRPTLRERATRLTLTVVCGLWAQSLLRDALEDAGAAVSEADADATGARGGADAVIVDLAPGAPQAKLAAKLAGAVWVALVARGAACQDPATKVPGKRARKTCRAIVTKPIKSRAAVDAVAAALAIGPAALGQGQGPGPGPASPPVFSSRLRESPRNNVNSPRASPKALPLAPAAAGPAAADVCRLRVLVAEDVEF
eukprot:tig00000042_g15453.t1